MKYIFAILSTLFLLAGLITMFQTGIIPYTVKTFFSLIFSGLFFFSIFGYIDCKQEVVYSQHYKRIRKEQMDGMLTSSILTGMILFLIIFTL